MNPKSEKINGEFGFTLVELIVSMGIFAIVMTMFTGFFITLFRLQTDYRATASLNQEARIVSETFSRFAREAKTVTLSNGYTSADSPCISACTVAYYKTVEFRLPRGVNAPSTEDITINFNGNDSVAKVFRINSASLTSSNIALTSFKIYRQAEGVYPKVLMYEFELAKKVNGVASTNTGEKVFFKGYVNMRNEL